MRETTKRILSEIIYAAGIAAGGALIGYTTGQFQGQREGRRGERQMILQSLDNRRFDVHQDARMVNFTGQNQDSILVEAGHLTYALNFLEPNYDKKKIEERAREDSIRKAGGKK